MLYEQAAMLKQVSDLLFDLLAAPRCLASRRRGRTPTAELWFGGRQLLADFGDRTENRLRQFLDDMKLADLMGNVAKQLGNGLRIRR
ncbi:MAG TPA: hypothetical protein VMY37_30825 [Thermoguttaceae bacterium]|nr:hypothetical protein [Thermoguttaceae bacterium]